MSQQFPKEEKLKSKKCIELLFAEGKSVSKFPLKIVYIANNAPKGALIQVGVSVTKKRFGKAVARNRIKRLMRESYRIHKNLIFNKITTSYALMFLYIGKEEPSYDMLQDTMRALLEKFLKEETVIKNIIHEKDI